MGIAGILESTSISDKEWKEGLIHLQNPSTGGIICEKQSDVDKFVGEGWINLDHESSLRDSKSKACKPGVAVMQNPTNGNIICVN